MALMASLALAATAAAPARAAGPSTAASFALSAHGGNGALLLRATPGRVARGAVVVRNLTRRPISVRLQAADIRNASNGNADYVTARPSQAGRWLRLAARTVHLKARAARRVAYTVTIPTGTRGASHYAGIVAVDAANFVTPRAGQTSKRNSFSFKRVNRQALPLTIRLPGRLSRSLALRSLDIKVEPAGAGLVLDLLPGGSVLIASAHVKLRVLRGSRTVLTHASTLGQLFPGDSLKFRIPWVGRPAKGIYRVVGVIRPERAAAVRFDQKVQFTPAKVSQLERRTTPVAPPVPLPGMPIWVWVALAAAAGLLVALSLAVFKLRRRPLTPAA